MKTRTDSFRTVPRGEYALPSDSERLKKMFSARLPEEAASSWLSPLSFSLPGSGRLTVHLPHELFFRWLSSSGRPRLEKAVREAGKLRTEGKTYVMQDGDVVEFKFNV